MKIFPALAAGLLLLVTGCNKDASPEAQVSAERLTGRGYELIAQQQPQLALGLFDQAIAGNAKNARAWQGKGLALNHLGKHAEADQAYGEALKLQPGAVNITNNLATSKILQGKYQEAADLLSPLAKAAKPNATVRENLALANCLLGKNENAKMLYSQNLTKLETDENLQFCKKFIAMKKR